MVMGSGKYSLDQMMNKPGYKRVLKKRLQSRYPWYLLLNKGIGIIINVI
jgi:hypothetical protein